MLLYLLNIYFCRYRRIINCLESIKLKDCVEEKEMNKLLSQAHTNLGICYNKENLPLKACIALRQVPIPTAKSHYQYVLLLANLNYIYKYIKLVYYNANSCVLVLGKLY